METTAVKQTAFQDLVTIEEYAVLVDKTPRTVYNWINEKRLPTHTMFGKMVLNKHDRPKD